MSIAADSLRRIADAADRMSGGPVLEPYVAPGRPVDRLGRAIPRNPFTGGLLLRLPGLAAEFKRVAPDEYRLGPWVLCVCGDLFVVELGEVAECPGACGRWFLRTEASVRVARWPVEVESDEDADARIAREAMHG